MKDYLKNYHVRMRTCAPVFIGDGTKVGNREYIFLPAQHKVIIPDLNRMYDALMKKGKRKAFEEYMLSEKIPLGSWLRDQGFSVRDYGLFSRYTLDAGEYFMASERTGGSKPPQDILCFMKDPYGQPYIPGSSLKGILRTALLAWIVKDNPKYQEQLDAIESAQSSDRASRRFLEKEDGRLERAVFHTLYRPDTRPDDAVNSIMSGLIVSDSSPLSTEQLTLSQKIDYSLDGNERRLPILRETLKPDTVLEFDVTIDSTVFPYEMGDLLEALDWFNGEYYEVFGKKFGRGNPEPGIVWLGGGSGFAAKTVIYALYPERRALELTDRIMWNTVGNKYTEHHHGEDISKGIAPHMYKCTRYDGKLYDMGMTKIEKISKI